MAQVKLNDQKNEPTSFGVYEGNEQVGEMIFETNNGNLTVFHTEVDPEAEGKGYAKQLLDAMVAYVRENKLMVIPMCTYVHLQFKRHEDLYSDIWNKANDK